MSHGYLLGVDIGTYESKGVLVTPGGRIVASRTAPHPLSIPAQGWAEHDPEEVWWKDLVSIVRGLMADSGVRPNEIIAVGASAIGPDLLPVDEECRPLRAGAILYGIDTRAAAEIEELEERLGKEAIFRTCGNALSSQAVGPKLLWLRRKEPEVYRRAFKFVTASTFLVARLTGRFVIDHLTASCWAPLYDFRGRTWGGFMNGIVEEHRLPELAWPAEIAGKLTRKAASETGLAEGTPVIVGTADAAAEAVSVGVVVPGQMMLMYGSTVFMYAVQDRPRPDERLWSLPYVFPGTFSVAGGMATSGALTRWFRDQLAPDLVAAEQDGGLPAYQALIQEAEKIPAGSEGLVVLPYFSGERTPINDPRARGVIFGLTLAHSRGHLFHAVLEGIGYGIKHHLAVLKDMDATPREIIAVGGGVKNPLWLRIVSDICQVPQKVPSVTVGAAYGDAFLAGLGAGVFASAADIGRWVSDFNIIQPNPAHAKRYEEYYETYLALYSKTRDLMHRLNPTSAV